MLVKLYNQNSKGTVYDKYKVYYSGIHKILRYCPNCNSDLFGEWSYDYRSIRFPKAIYPPNPYNTERITFHPEDTYIKEGRLGSANSLEYAKRRDITKYNEILDITPTVKKYRQEIEMFLSMDICPICGEKLPNDELNTLVVNGIIDSRVRITEGNHTNYSPEFLRNFKEAKIGDSIKFNNKIGVKIADEWLEFYNPDDNESILRYFRSHRESDVLSKATNRLKTFINKYDIQESDYSSPVECINNDTSKLREFISHLVQLETNIFSLTERLKSLYCANIEYKLDAFASTRVIQLKIKSYVDNLRKEYEDLVNKGAENAIKIDDVLIKYPSKPSKPEKSEYPTKPIYPVLKKANIFNKKSVTAENESAIKKYNIECAKYTESCKLIDDEFTNLTEKYNKEYKEFEQAVIDFESKRKEIYDERVLRAEKELELAVKRNDIYETESDSITTAEIIKSKWIDDEISKAEELLKALYVTRNKLYGSGVVFEKYRNFVAVASFYEYLCTGRCTHLEGADGAYNIYENEIRLDNVIGELSHVIKSLEQVQKNQYVIYSAIKETNKQLKLLNTSMENAVNSLNRIKVDIIDINNITTEIKNNTEIAAYHSQVNAYYSKNKAELANATEFMMAFK